MGTFSPHPRAPHPFGGVRRRTSRKRVGICRKRFPHHTTNATYSSGASRVALATANTNEKRKRAESRLDSLLLALAVLEQPAVAAPGEDLVPDPEVGVRRPLLRVVVLHVGKAVDAEPGARGDGEESHRTPLVHLGCFFFFKCKGGVSVVVGRGAFRFGRSSPPRFPARTEGVGSRLRCLAESRETTAEGPPGSDGRRWTAAVATREGWDGICPKISTSALDWREGGAGRVSHRSLLRCCRRTCCGGRPARGPSPRDEPGSRARCVRTSCLGAVCDGTRSPGRWLPVPNPAANHDSGPARGLASC